jgi:glucan phosphorylase
MRLLFDRYFGMDWYNHLDEPDLWTRIENIPDLELWDVRRHLKRKLINYAIESARDHWQTGKRHASQVIADGVMLDQYSLTIGFARRFASYKRANLIFSDYERLLRLVTNRDMPVQINDPDEQDAKDAASLYDTLEHEIIPMYYQHRAMGDASPVWIAKIKENMRTLAWQFSTRRMLKDYLQKMYLPAIKESKIR